MIALLSYVAAFLFVVLGSIWIAQKIFGQVPKETKNQRTLNVLQKANQPKKPQRKPKKVKTVHPEPVGSPKAPVPKKPVKKAPKKTPSKVPKSAKRAKKEEKEVGKKEETKKEKTKKEKTKKEKRTAAEVVSSHIPVPAPTKKRASPPVTVPDITKKTAQPYNAEDDLGFTTVKKRDNKRRPPKPKTTKHHSYNGSSYKRNYNGGKKSFQKSTSTASSRTTMVTNPYANAESYWSGTRTEVESPDSKESDSNKPTVVIKVFRNIATKESSPWGETATTAETEKTESKGFPALA